MVDTWPPRRVFQRLGVFRQSPDERVLYCGIGTRRKHNRMYQLSMLGTVGLRILLCLLLFILVSMIDADVSRAKCLAYEQSAVSD